MYGERRTDVLSIVAIMARMSGWRAAEGWYALKGRRARGETGNGAKLGYIKEG